MVDAFLLEHQINPLIYAIGGGLNPASIKDQMIRARMMVDKAYEAALIGPKRALLVIGLGAAGATASLHAAMLGVETILVEKRSNPFYLQRESTRELNPTAYDWPHTHWHEGIMPWGDTPRMPLVWAAGKANDIAAAWLSQLEEISRILPHLSIRMNQPVLVNNVCMNNKDGMLDIQISPEEIRPFGMLLACTGSGPECCEIGTYTGMQFWGSNTLQNDNLGTDNTPVQVAISGCGDGALQDYLHILTGNYAPECYSRLKDKMPLTVQPIFHTIEQAILSAETQAQAALKWSTTQQNDHKILNRLHNIHTRQVDILLENKVIIKRVKKLIVNRSIDIKLFHSCTHFTTCYPINRFLVILIERYLKKMEDKETIKPETKLISVVSADPENHKCKNNSNACYGKQHIIQYAQHVRCTEQNIPITEQTEANVIIIRHGITPSQNEFQTDDIRQILPLHIA